MDAEDLRALQQPLKDSYRSDPAAAVITLRARGDLGEESVSCSVETGGALAVAGLHPATGGDGTLRAVATSLGIDVAGGTVRAEGDLDFRGTLAVAKDAPVGFTSIRLSFELDSGASPAEMDTLLRLTERYCVVYQTLARPAQLTASLVTAEH